MTRKITFGAAMLAVVGMAFATPLLQEFTLKLTPKEGDVAKYMLKADIDIQGTQASFNGKVTEKTIKVEADGTYQIESTNSDGKVVFGGQEMEMPASEPTITVYKANGEVKEIKGAGVDANAYRMSGISSFRWPTKAVKVGDEWTSEWAKDDKTGAVAGKATFKVEAEEKVGAWETVKIKMSTKESEGDSPATAEGTIWLAKADGKMVKTEAAWKNAPFPGAPGPIDAKVTLTRTE